MRRCLDVLTQKFPGRLIAHAGDSLHVVGSLAGLAATRLAPPCALVHIDGRHAYFNVLVDAIQLAAHATGEDTLYVFDDQCDAKACETPTPTPLEPTLATCDMERAGLLRRVSLGGARGGRGWAVYRPGAVLAARSATRLSPSSHTHDHTWCGKANCRNESVVGGGASGLLPCTRPCRLRFGSRISAAARAVREQWTRRKPSGEVSPESQIGALQRHVRPPTCALKLAPVPPS